MRLQFLVYFTIGGMIFTAVTGFTQEPQKVFAEQIVEVEIVSPIEGWVRGLIPSPSGKEFMVDSGQSGDSRLFVTLGEVDNEVVTSKRDIRLGLWDTGEGIDSTLSKRKNRFHIVQRDRFTIDPIEPQFKHEYRFEDQDGNRVLPGEPLLSVAPSSYITPGALRPYIGRLFFIEGDLRKEITPPDFEGGVFRFSFDGIRRRVCADTASVWIIFDIESGKRELLPNYLPAMSAFLKLTLVPGHDFIILRRAIMDQSGDKEVDWRLELTDLKGNTKQELSLAFKDYQGRMKPEHILATEHLIAYTLQRGGVSALKVYKTLPISP